VTAPDVAKLPVKPNNKELLVGVSTGDVVAVPPRAEETPVVFHSNGDPGGIPEKPATVICIFCEPEDRVKVAW
jgi:hypothetical protein